MVIITEANVPHEENNSYFGHARNEAQTLEGIGGGATFFSFLASHDGIGLHPVTSVLSQDEINMLVQRIKAHGDNVSYKPITMVANPVLL